jgi:DNA-binding phage protein
VLTPVCRSHSGCAPFGALPEIAADPSNALDSRNIGVTIARRLPFTTKIRRASKMPLTREFKNTVQARLRADSNYRMELLRKGVECLLAGDLDTGKAILRDYINATIGFDELSRRTNRPAKSLMRMLGPSGNPHARNLLDVIQHLRQEERVHFELSLRTGGRRT